MNEAKSDDSEADEDFFKCITDTANPGKTWCGEAAEGWCFTDVNHAALVGRAKTYTIACRACAAAVIEAMKEGDLTPEADPTPTAPPAPSR